MCTTSHRYRNRVHHRQEQHRTIWTKFFIQIVMCLENNIQVFFFFAKEKWGHCFDCGLRTIKCVTVSLS